MEKRLNLIKHTYLKSAQEFDSFDISTGIIILVFRVSVAIELGHSLHTVHYHELFDSSHVYRLLLLMSDQKSP